MLVELAARRIVLDAADCRRHRDLDAGELSHAAKSVVTFPWKIAAKLC